MKCALANRLFLDCFKCAFSYGTNVPVANPSQTFWPNKQLQWLHSRVLQLVYMSINSSEINKCLRTSDWAGLNMTQDYNHRDRNDHLYQTWNDEQKNYAKYLNNDFIHDNKQHICVLNTKEFNYVMLNCIPTYLHKKRLCNIELHTINKHVYQLIKGRIQIM